MTGSIYYSNCGILPTGPPQSVISWTNVSDSIGRVFFNRDDKRQFGNGMGIN